MRILFYRGRAEFLVVLPPEGALLLDVDGACACSPGALRVRGVNLTLGPAVGEVSADAACSRCGALVGRLEVAEDAAALAQLEMRVRLRVTEALACLPFFENKSQAQTA